MTPTRNIDALVEHIARHPGMYVNPATVDGVVAYLTGYDHGRCGEPLAGFREWLIVRADGFNNFHWTALALREITGTLNPREPHDDHPELIAALCGLLREYLAYRAVHEPGRVNLDYDSWLRRQEWYRDADGPGDESATQNGSD